MGAGGRAGLAVEEDPEQEERVGETFMTSRRAKPPQPRGCGCACGPAGSDI